MEAAKGGKIKLFVAGDYYLVTEPEYNVNSLWPVRPLRRNAVFLPC